MKRPDGLNDRALDATADHIISATERHVFVRNRLPLVLPPAATAIMLAEVRMRFENCSFGSIRIDGTTYEHDVVVDRGQVRKRKKKASKKFRDEFGHTPLSIEEEIP